MRRLALVVVLFAGLYVGCGDDEACAAPGSGTGSFRPPSPPPVRVSPPAPRYSPPPVRVAPRPVTPARPVAPTPHVEPAPHIPIHTPIIRSNDKDDDKGDC